MMKHMFRNHTNVTICCLGVSLLIFCSRATQQGHQEGAAEAGTTQESFRVEFGEQGGITGEYAGYTIDETGAVQRVQRMPGKDETLTPSGAVTHEDVASLMSIVETIGFFQIVYSQTGNMVYSITVRRGGDDHTVSWPMGDENTPEDLIILRRYLTTLIKKAR
jgi:hypothetical protein